MLEPSHLSNTGVMYAVPVLLTLKSAIGSSVIFINLSKTGVVIKYLGYFGSADNSMGNVWHFEQAKSRSNCKSLSVHTF